MFEGLICKIKRVTKCQFNRACKHYYEIIAKYKWIFPVKYDEIRFKSLSGYELSWDNPKTLNEKLFWLNRYWQPELKSLCADKIRMHEYLREKGLSDMSVPVLGTWNSAEEIDFDALPDKFVLKCNHGCAYNIICTDKSQLNRKEAITLLNGWLKEDYARYFGEWHYSRISPKILCEKYLEALDNGDLKDYKVYCFSGKPCYVLVCANRDEQGNALFATYSMDWKTLPYVRKERQCQLEPPPKFLDDLKAAASLLCADFPFVRLDFYYVDEKLYLGEFTFTPQGNYITYNEDSLQVKMGELLNLPMEFKPNR